MATYLTPGVYYERADAGPPTIQAVRTDVAGFVGLAPRGVVDTAVPIESWRQFEAHFGGFTGAGFLAYAVRGFFENRGKRCWVVRVASKDPVGGAQSAAMEAGNTTVPLRGVWRIAASTPGVWGNVLRVFMEETHRAQTVAWLDPNRPDRLSVASTAGFERGTLVKLSQHTLAHVLQVVAAVDATEGFLESEVEQAVIRKQKGGASSDFRKFLYWTPAGREVDWRYETPPMSFDPAEPIVAESVEYTLVVEQGGIPIALYRGLSLIPHHPDYGPDRLDRLRIPTNVEPRKLPSLPEPVVIEELRPEYRRDSSGGVRRLELLALPTAPVDLTGGADGLRLLTTYDFIGEPADPLESDEVKESKTRGLRVLEAIEELSILAVPDINIQPVLLPPAEPPVPCVPDPCLPTTAVPVAPPPPVDVSEQPPTFSDADIYRVQAALVQQCEDKRDRFALLDPPRSASRDDELGLGAAQAWRHQFDSTYAAFYYPWLRVSDPLRSSTALTRDIPSCGHVAGQMAQTDLTIGVHKAPANAPLQWVQDVTVAINDAQHALLNPLGINAIRTLPGRGIRIFGARTVSSDPDWRYVNVRRLLMMIEKAIDLSTQWAVFEPNDAITRAKIRLSLTSFLLSLWERGALVGGSAEEAFFLRCDETNNPPSERENGRLWALIGVAPTNPFEFVVLRVGRVNDEFEISEQGTRKGGG